MPTAVWLRRFAPSSLILALLCFDMPWIEIRCDDPKAGLIVTTRSGLQATYGGTSISAAGKPVSDAERQQARNQVGEREKGAPLLIGYAACLLIALTSSLLLWDTPRGWLSCVAATTGAVLFLVI
jgi:hypothetical protein